MSWVKGLKITDGLLTGEVFQRIDTDMNMMSWSVYPDTEVSTLKYVQGSGLRWQSIDILNMLRSQEAGSTVLYAGCDIETSEGSQYIRAQMRWEITKSGSCYVKLKYRGYTDDNNYVDTVISPIDLVIAPVDLERALAIYLFFTVSNYAGESMIFTGVNPCWVSPGAVNEYHVDGWACSYFNFITNVTQGTWEEEETSPEFGPAAEPEGYDGGSFDDHSDTVDFPTDPQSILGLGFINVYKCTTNSLVDFGAALFPEITWPQSLSDVGEVIAALSDSIWNSRLIDYVISVHCVPGDVPAGALEDIKVGARTMTGILARKITNEYVTFDFGSIQTGRIFKNYADIMTSCKVFLPFYGFVPLPAEYWNGCTLTLKYKFNVIDGSFMAYLKASDCYYSKLNGIIGQYGGSAVVHMPTTGANYASMFANVIGSGAKLASGIASGNVGKVASSTVSIAANIGGGGDAQGSESYNASSSFMSMRTPFLLIELPVPQFPTKYAPEKGLPANITYVLGTLQGLVICDSPRIAFACTEDEQKEIVAALQEGIII